MRWKLITPQFREACKKAATKHGLYRDPAYTVWVSVRYRCLNPKCPEYARYGGRGIKICDRWLESPEPFIRDMGPRPSLAHGIERIDNDGNYEPSNCRWATMKEQCNNRSSNVLITFQGRTMNIAQWATELGISATNIRQRLQKYNMPLDLAMSKTSLKRLPKNWRLAAEHGCNIPSPGEIEES